MATLSNGFIWNIQKRTRLAQEAKKTDQKAAKKQGPFSTSENLYWEIQDREPVTLQYLYVLGEFEKDIKLIYKIPKVWSFSVFIHIFYPLSYIIVSFEPWV